MALFTDSSHAEPDYRIRLTPLGRCGIRAILVERVVVRNRAANGPDGWRRVAAGVLANLGEEPPLHRETTQQRLLIELLTALRAGNLRENLTQGLIEAISSQADDLWRGGHPAAADTIEATAAAIRGTDKALAKQLRRSAHQASTRSAETRGGLACGLVR